MRTSLVTVSRLGEWTMPTSQKCESPGFSTYFPVGFTKLAALAITSAQRNPTVPELMPIRETMPELRPFDVSAWFGAFLPGGTPAPIVESQIALWKGVIDKEGLKLDAN
jgi:hypothetical protein